MGTYRIAWTGGSRPPKRRYMTAEERKLTHIFFRVDIGVHVRYWNGFFDGLYSARVIYRRCMYDAHATVREQKEN